jgi:hypothetical protein
MPKHRGKCTRHKDEGAKNKKRRGVGVGGISLKNMINEEKKCTRNRR